MTWPKHFCIDFVLKFTYQGIAEYDLARKTIFFNWYKKNRKGDSFPFSYFDLVLLNEKTYLLLLLLLMDLFFELELLFRRLNQSNLEFAILNGAFLEYISYL